MSSDPITHIQSRDNSLLKELRRLSHDSTAYIKKAVCGWKATTCAALRWPEAGLLRWRFFLSLFGL